MEDLDFIKQNLPEDETIECTSKFSKKAYYKNLIMANLIYIIFWVLFDIFFIYIMFKEGVSSEYWFVMIPAIGFNLIIIWAYSFKIVKDFNTLEKTEYVLTNKAFYKCNNGKTYKSITRISLDDIIVIERSEYIRDGYYVASKNQSIKIFNIDNEEELFNRIVKKIKEE